MGGRYVFTEADLPGLRHDLKTSGNGPKDGPSLHDRFGTDFLDQDKGMPPEVLELIAHHPFYREKFRRYRRDARAARQQRLRTQMDAVLPERYDDEEVLG